MSKSKPLPLDLEVRQLLGSRKGDWQEIARDADVSYSWLSKFFNGRIDNPGYMTLRKIHARLTQREHAKAA